MFLTEVIPLTKIPRQGPSPFFYFTSQKLNKGSLVLVSLRRKEVFAIVISQKDVKETKLELKTVSYQLKPIKEVLINKEIIGFPFLDLAQWISEYYFSSISNSLLLFLPQKIVKKIVKKDGFNFPKIKPQLEEKNFLKPKVFISKTGFLPKDEIKNVLREGRQILFLFPQILQKTFWENNFKKISSSLIFWSPQTSIKKFFNNFQKVKDKEVQIIFGQISALFAPFCDLGLIIIFDPENSSFKAKKEPLFNTKDVAQKMAQMLNIDFLQLDSFLSLENYYLKSKNKVKIIKENNNLLSADNQTNKKSILNFSKLKFIERSQGEKFNPISEQFFNKIQSYIEKNKKVILFLNRKGVSTSVFCQDCGFTIKCKDCNLPLTYHLKKEKPYLLCHHCGRESNVPSYCPNCGSWQMRNIGVGIEGVEKFLKEKFKENGDQVSILRLDKDSISSKEVIIENFSSDKKTILLTTKLIFNFPEITADFVGIVSLESLLSLPNFKAKEEALKIIHNLNIIAKEELALQIFSQKNDFHQLLKDNQFSQPKIFDIFLQERKLFFYPPYSSLIKLTFLDKNLKRAIEAGEKLKNDLEKIRDFLKIPQENFQVLGPAPAFVAKRKQNFVFHILIKENLDDINKRNKILRIIPPSWEIDIDPIQVI